LTFLAINDKKKPCSVFHCGEIGAHVRFPFSFGGKTHEKPFSPEEGSGTAENHRIAGGLELEAQRQLCFAGLTPQEAEQVIKAAGPQYAIQSLECVFSFLLDRPSSQEERDFRDQWRVGVDLLSGVLMRELGRTEDEVRVLVPLRFLPEGWTGTKQELFLILKGMQCVFNAKACRSRTLRRPTPAQA
jgi:hypothetical protein